MTEQTEKQLPALPAVQVKFTPAVIEVNIDDLKTALTAQVEEQSNTVVTADNLAACKKLMADMNNTRKAISAARIEYAKKAGVNILIFENSMKELEKMSDAGVAKIKVQAEKFEQETLRLIEIALGEFLGAEWDRMNVEAEFRNAKIKDLVLLGAFTSTNKLTGKAKAEVTSRATIDKQWQDQTAMRLMALKLASHEAGLAAPLTRAHVAVFLFDDEPQYQEKLAEILASEVEREKVAQQRIRDQQAAEALRNQQAADAAAEQVRLANERARQAEENAAKVVEQAKQQVAEVQIQAVPVQPVAQPLTTTDSYHAPSTKFAYAPLAAPNQAAFFVGDCAGAVDRALSSLGAKDQIGIWTKADGLIAIIHNGTPFFRNI